MKAAAYRSAFLLSAARPGQSSSARLSRSWLSGRNILSNASPILCSGAGMTTSPFLCTSRKGPLSCLGQPDHESLQPPTGSSSSWALPERDSLRPACWGKVMIDSSGHLQRLVEAGAGWGEAPSGLCLSPRDSLMGWHTQGKTCVTPTPTNSMAPAICDSQGWPVSYCALGCHLGQKHTPPPHQPMEGDFLHIWEFCPRHYSKCSDTLAHFIPRGGLDGRCYFNCQVTDKRTEAQGAYLKDFTSYSASKEW